MSRNHDFGRFFQSCSRCHIKVSEVSGSVFGTQKRYFRPQNMFSSRSTSTADTWISYLKEGKNQRGDARKKSCACAPLIFKLRARSAQNFLRARAQNKIFPSEIKDVNLPFYTRNSIIVCVKEYQKSAPPPHSWALDEKQHCSF